MGEGDTTLLGGLIRDPVMAVALLLLAVVGAAIMVWRLAILLSRLVTRSRDAATGATSNPAFKNLIGRAVTVRPDANIGDDLFTGGGTALDRR